MVEARHGERATAVDYELALIELRVTVNGRKLTAKRLDGMPLKDAAAILRAVQ